MLDSTGSPIVAVGLLAYTFLEKKKVLSGAHGFTKTFLGRLHKCRVLRCGL